MAQGIEGAENYVFRATLDQDVLLSGGGCADEGDTDKSCDSDSEEARDEHLEWWDQEAAVRRESLLDSRGLE